MADKNIIQNTGELREIFLVLGFQEVQIAGAINDLEKLTQSVAFLNVLEILDKDREKELQEHLKDKREEALQQIAVEFLQNSFSKEDMRRILDNAAREVVVDYFQAMLADADDVKREEVFKRVNRLRG